MLNDRSKTLFLPIDKRVLSMFLPMSGIDHTKNFDRRMFTPAYYLNPYSMEMGTVYHERHKWQVVCPMVRGYQKTSRMKIEL